MMPGNMSSLVLPWRNTSPFKQDSQFPTVPGFYEENMTVKSFYPYQI
jgi:hypothetical protein